MLLFGAFVRVMCVGAMCVGVMCCVALPSTARASPDTGEVLLSDVGSGFTLVDERPAALGTLIRLFQRENGQLELTGTPVTTPPGVGAVFNAFFTLDADVEVVPEPSLDLAVWLVDPGTRVGDGGSATLAFASRNHLFVFKLADGSGAIDGPAFLRELAVRQVEAAGGPPAPDDTSRDRSRDDELVAMLPAAPPPEYGLTSSATTTGSDELEGVEAARADVADFLNRNSVTAVRVWRDSNGELSGAVSITRYPYEIFAAAHLGAVIDTEDSIVQSTDALADVPGVVLFTDTGTTVAQVGTAFRRGEYVVSVAANHAASVPTERAAALTADLTRLVASGMPAGDTAPYALPSTPSKFAGVGLTAAIVTGAAAGSAAVARLRARRVRRRWAGGAFPAPVMADGAARGGAIALDTDARQLRRQGTVVAGGQLVAVNVSIVALAGDFAWPGVVVATVAFLAGLVMTRMWQRRELNLLGTKAPAREFVLPRPAGLIAGVLSLAVLGFGIAFALKGFRYLVLPTGLAQLKWSDRLGIAPRSVGILFAIGGLVVAAIGGGLFRIARALGHAGTKRVLEKDRRPAALYLRSFDDDSLPLPTIASARRPLFELFSLRGADPFEEAVAWELNSYGPVVAVARPGRTRATLGAAREHLTDDTWRDQVANRMDEAGIIAVATGETDGLAWELGQVVSGGHLAKTFFVFPPVAPDALDRRWAHTTASLADHGLTVGPLPAPPSLIHTVRLTSDGTATVTYASRRDEATYRTAVDRALDTEQPEHEPDVPSTHDTTHTWAVPAGGGSK